MIWAVPRESNFESTLRRAARAAGGRADKWIGTVGAPDRIILLPGLPRLLVETKSAEGRLSEEQRATHADLRRLGETVVVARSKSGIPEPWRSVLWPGFTPATAPADPGRP